MGGKKNIGIVVIITNIKPQSMNIIYINVIHNNNYKDEVILELIKPKEQKIFWK